MSKTSHVQRQKKLAKDQRRVALDTLAGKVRKALEDNPTLTINILASQLGSTIQDVTKVLDEYLCHEDGLQHAGPGQGGGWVPQPDPAPVGQHAGYRWPDGELHDEPWEPDAH